MISIVVSPLSPFWRYSAAGRARAAGSAEPPVFSSAVSSLSASSFSPVCSSSAPSPPLSPVSSSAGSPSTDSSFSVGSSLAYSSSTGFSSSVGASDASGVVSDSGASTTAEMAWGSIASNSSQVSGAASLASAVRVHAPVSKSWVRFSSWVAHVHSLIVPDDPTSPAARLTAGCKSVVPITRDRRTAIARLFMLRTPFLTLVCHSLLDAVLTSPSRSPAVPSPAAARGSAPPESGHWP